MGSSEEATGHLTTEELFRQHAGFVARFLTRLGVPEEQLEDALQEVFLVAHRNGGYRPGLAKPTSYLANIAIRAAAQHRRRQGVARSRHSEAPLDQLSGEVEDPARAVQVRQDLQRLQQALERLPEDLCTTLVLVEIEGESCVSVAAGLGCPVGTIYWRLHQARKELQTAVRALETPRRSPQAAPQLGERAQPTRSFMVLFGLDGFNRTEASRLLQLAREQPSPNLALDALLARHQQLLHSGNALPAWASSFTPHSPSLWALLGAGPITVGLAASAAIVATALITTQSATQPQVTSQAATATSQQPAIEVPTSAPDPAPSATLSLGGIAPALRGGATSDAEPAAAPIGARKVRREAHAKAPARDRSERVAREALAAPQARSDEDKPELAQQQEPAQQPEPQPDPARSKALATTDAQLAEMREIQRAERLLSDDPGEALALTRTMQTGFPAGHFREERDYLEVMALRELGRTGEMRDKAAAFLRAYPTGLYSSRVRKAAATRAE